MAEYMDYDDTIYDELDHKSKSKKIRSWISFIIAVVFLLSCVVLVIVRMPENVRAKFSAVSSAKYTVGDTVGSMDKSPMYQLYQQMTKDEKVTVNDEFAKNNKFFSDMLSQAIQNGKQTKVYHNDNNGILTVVQCYGLKRMSGSGEVSENSDKQMDADILMLPYSSADNKITVSQPIRFSVAYYCGSGMNFIKSKYVRTEEFRLNFYKISIDVKSGKNDNIADTTVKLALSDGISKKENENRTFEKYMTVQNGDGQKTELISGGDIGDTEVEQRLYAGNIATSIKTELKFDDTLYRKFERFEMSAEKGDQFTVTVN